METELKRFYPLGNRTLAMLILKRSFIVIFLFIVLLVFLFYFQYIPEKYINIALSVLIVYLIVLLIIFIVSFFLGWLEYWRYEIILGDKNLQMQRGLITVEQVGIPYRHIQDIKIERSLLDQIMGVSELMVTITGSEQQEIYPGEKYPGQLHKIILPAIEKKIARHIQEIVLNKSQIQQIQISNKV